MWLRGWWCKYKLFGIEPIQMLLLGPPSVVLGVFEYLLENQYRLEHLKFTSVQWQIITLKQVENS
jgi:hypothetical protein